MSDLTSSLADVAGSSVDHHPCLVVSFVVTAFPLGGVSRNSQFYIVHHSLSPVSTFSAATFLAVSFAAPGPQAQYTQAAVFSAVLWLGIDAVN